MPCPFVALLYQVREPVHVTPSEQGQVPGPGQPQARRELGRPLLVHCTLGSPRGFPARRQLHVEKTMTVNALPACRGKRNNQACPLTASSSPPQSKALDGRQLRSWQTVLSGRVP